MSKCALHRLDGQAGFTLIELIITLALSALLMGVLVSVFLTTTRAIDSATGRVEASGQVRTFESFAYEDFTGSAVSDFGSGCTSTTPCSTGVTLTEVPIANPTQRYTVTYAWDQTNQVLNRTVGGVARHAASNVTGFEWYIDANQSVVISLSITVNSYTQSQTFRFYPRRNP